MELIFTLDKISDAARAFAGAMGDRTVFAFYGQMGAGKTTFIKAVSDQLGVTSSVNSPTFAIINEYHTTGGRNIYHFDFYRIKQPGEAFDIGCEDYFYSGDCCFIEWPEKIEGLLPLEAVEVHIDILPDGRRRLSAAAL